MSTIPTGEYTPAMDYASSAGIINPKGILGIFSNVYNFSYEHFNSIDYSKFIQKYWWLRSPYTDYGIYACYVMSEGDIRINGYSIHVDDSYGRIIAGHSQ